MKKVIIFTIVIVLIMSSLNISIAKENNYLRASFTESIVTGTSFKQITIEPYRYDNKKIEDDEETIYYIYLPSGYLIEGKTASFVADKDGTYPFTVYYGTNKKTFLYNVKDIDKLKSTENEDSNKDNKLNKGLINYQLMYDYEKKQVFFNMQLDKLRSVSTPDGTFITNQVNYFIKALNNNEFYDFKITIEDETFNYKVIKSGEYYLLIYISPVNYNDYSTLVEYHGYNFTSNDYFEAFPAKDIYDDNGNYNVLLKSSNSKHLFSFNIDGIDYRSPSVDIEMLEDYTFNIKAEDDFELDYIITFDGQYIKASNNKFSYNHKTEINYNGEYIFSVVDKEGNKTVEKFKMTYKRKPRKHDINLEVHDYKYTNDLFKNIGIKYNKIEAKKSSFNNILPAYMNGKNLTQFKPNSFITRAEMITIFCRLNDLPYDTNLYLKTKFIDINDHWARDYISMGSNKKYISGYKDKTFKPNNNVTRAEFCQMLTKISSYKTLLNDLPAASNYSFNDISGHWAEKEIIKIASRNLVISENDSFYPDKAITRGEVVHAINMLYNLNPSYVELAYINKLYSKFFSYTDIDNYEYYYDIIISVVGMYRENID